MVGGLLPTEGKQGFDMFRQGEQAGARIKAVGPEPKLTQLPPGMRVGLMDLDGIAFPGQSDGGRNAGNPRSNDAGYGWVCSLNA